MRITLNVRLSCVCGICKQERDEAKAAHVAIDVALFGSVRYAVCVNCGLKVERPWGDAYKARWEARLAQREQT